MSIKILLVFASLFVGVLSENFTILEDNEYKYPKVRRDESVVDDYHGTKIADPYRWLENPDSEETKEFIEQQNNLTFTYLEAANTRSQIRKRLTELMNYEKTGCPTKAGSRYFYKKNSGLQNQYVFYVQDTFNSEPKVFIDPNTLSEDGTVTLSGTYFSKDGGILAYGIQKSGSDWKTVHFKNVSTGEDFPDTLHYLKFLTLIWTRDNSGVFYNRYPQPDGAADGSETTPVENAKLYYHKLGTNQSEDILLVEYPENPQWFIDFEISDDDKYLIVKPELGIGEQQVYYAYIEDFLAKGTKSKLDLKPIITQFEAYYRFIANDGPVFYFRTNKGAPNNKIIGIDLNTPEEKYWSTLIPEHPTDVLTSASVVHNNYLVLAYLRDVKSVVEVHSLANGTFIKTLTSSNDAGEADVCYNINRNDTQLFFTFESFLVPSKILYVDFTNDTLTPTVWKEEKLKGFEPDIFETTQVFFKSKDGTRVSMFIVHKKGLVLNGDSPTNLYGYGGYGVNTLPWFSPSRALFLQNFNGIYALATIRGGGEYGTKWWNGGRLLNKQNSFDDFQAAAEYLIANNYTKPAKLYIEGGSNGGLLVGACANQRPELYGAVINHVGVLDMLRYQKFTIGYLWCSEFGCSEDKQHFNNLLKYSPLHNIRVPKDEKVQYPAILVTTGDHDDRVVPLHSYKYISELQNTIGRSSKQTNPMMIRIEAKAGHGGGKPTSKKIDEKVDVFSFLVLSLGFQFNE